VFFYGLHEQQEVSMDLEPGKTLLIRLQGRTEIGRGRRQAVLRTQRPAAP
jgi:pyruvate carboxylase